jgi:TonB-dependent SusC/RagA subfamily outer membrane receptor
MHNAPRFNYLSRIMMIPLIALLLFTFAVKAKTLDTGGNKGSAGTKTVSGMIDTGHPEKEAAEKTDTVPKPKKLKKLTLVYADGSKETITPEEYQKRTESRKITIRIDSDSLKGSGIIDGESFSLKGSGIIDPDARIDGYFIEKTGKDSMKVVINGTGSAVTIKGDPNKPRPLYIVNGKELTEFDIKDIDPNSIEKITVLKGASAESMYKEKGKNGVVIITLKK